MLVINKPAGLSVHTTTHSATPTTSTLADWLLQHYPTIAKVGEPMTDGNGVPRPGLVHRLDKDTSGVMIIAKTQPAFLYLKSKFRAHDLIKHYRAVAYGKIKQDAGTINLPLGRSRRDARLRVAGRNAIGQLREASTVYQGFMLPDAPHCPDSPAKRSTPIPSSSSSPKPPRHKSSRPPCRPTSRPLLIIWRPHARLED